jgi:hypothetical protein
MIAPAIPRAIIILTEDCDRILVKFVNDKKDGSLTIITINKKAKTKYIAF